MLGTGAGRPGDSEPFVVTRSCNMFISDIQCNIRHVARCPFTGFTSLRRRGTGEQVIQARGADGAVARMALRPDVIKEVLNGRDDPPQHGS